MRTAVNGPPSSVSRMSLRLACLAPLLALSGCQWAILDPKGPVGLAERTILIDSLVIMLAIVVPTIAATLGFAWWYRASNTKARHLPEFAYSGRIEVMTWTIPLLTITLLGGVTWISSHQLDPARPIDPDTPPLEVQVVSLDWKWLFIYPNERVASVNRLVVPAGRPVHFTLTSSSVMNSFFVPRLGSSIYTMNGMATQLYLRADEPGTYPGIAAHFSGDGFSDMHFEVVAVPQDRFAGSIDEMRHDGPALDAASYAELQKQSVPAHAFSYRDADPNLFQKIVSLEVPPGPGPPIKERGAGKPSQMEQ